MYAASGRKTEYRRRRARRVSVLLVVLALLFTMLPTGLYTVAGAAEATETAPPEPTPEPPADDTTDDPANVTTDDPANVTTDDPANVTTDDPANVTTDDPADVTTDDPADDITDRAAPTILPTGPHRRYYRPGRTDGDSRYRDLLCGGGWRLEAGGNGSDRPNRQQRPLLYYGGGAGRHLRRVRLFVGGI